MDVVLGNSSNNVVVIDGSGGITVSSNISGTDKKLTLQGGGSGALTLSGANTYSGGTTVAAGTLAVGHDSGLGSGAVSVTGGSVSLGSGLTVGNSFTVGSAGTLRSASGSATLSGLVKGTGTLGAAGTTLSFASGGTLAPGNSAGSMTIAGTVNMLSGSIYQWELNSLTTTGAGTSFDQMLVAASGTLSIASGAILQPVFIAGATAPSLNNSFWDATRSWVIAANPSGGTVSAVALVIDNTGWATRGSFSTGIVANDLIMTWTPIPEPSTYAAIIGGLALVGVALRRRRQGR